MPPNLFPHITLGVSTLFYAIVIMGLTLGIRRLRPATATRTPFVSVIVAARNEEMHIHSLIEHLMRQDYPDFEVVVVNDRSSDKTGILVDKFRTHHSNLVRVDVLSANDDMPPKKNALAKGIAVSRGEILAFTDADCLPPPSWLSNIVSGFDENVGLVAGYSPYIQNKSDRRQSRSIPVQLLQHFIQFEEFKGAAWSAGAIGLQKGWLCTGRSLAYRRAVYEEVNGFEQIKQSVSGDDDLFLQLVRRQTRWQIRFCISPMSFVPTYAPETFKDFVRQRARHFSAGRYFSFPMKLFFLTFHTASLALFASLIGFLFTGKFIFAICYVAKCIFDLIFFITAANVFREMRFFWTFVPMEMLIVLYNSLIGPLGFLGRVEWKSERP